MMSVTKCPLCEAQQLTPKGDDLTVRCTCHCVFFVWHCPECHRPNSDPLGCETHCRNPECGAIVCIDDESNIEPQFTNIVFKNGKPVNIVDSEVKHTANEIIEWFENIL